MHEWWVATMSRAAEEGDCVAGCSSSEVAGMCSGVLCVGAEGMRARQKCGGLRGLRGAVAGAAMVEMRSYGSVDRCGLCLVSGMALLCGVHNARF